jgi:hypothetical protein
VSVALVPAAWSIVGGSASLLLEAPADYVLLACGPALAVKVWLGDGRARVEWRTS